MAKPQLVGYVDEEIYHRVSKIAKTEGVSISKIVEELTIIALPAREEWNQEKLKARDDLSKMISNTRLTAN